MTIYAYNIRLSADAKMTQAKWKKKYCSTFDYNRHTFSFTCTISVILADPEKWQIMPVPPRVGKTLVVQNPNSSKTIVEYRVTESGASPEAAFWHAYTVIGINLRIW